MRRNRSSRRIAAVVIAIASAAAAIVALTGCGATGKQVVVSGYVTGTPPLGWPASAAVYLYPGIVTPGHSTHPLVSIAGTELDDIGFELRAREGQLSVRDHGYATATVIAWGIEDHVLSYDRFCAWKVIRLRLVNREGTKLWVGADGNPVWLSLELPFDTIHERCP